MSKIKQTLLALINRIGQKLPKRLLRKLADTPIVFNYMVKISRGEFREVTTPEGYRLVMNPLFHSNLLKTGDLAGYEPELRQTITKYTGNGMTAYDIGANIGVFSLLFASLVGKKGRVYAFEPEKNNYECLIKSVELNHVNIIPDDRAISCVQSEQQFDRRGGAFSGRLVGNNTQYKTSENIATVKTVSIDHLVINEGYRVPDIVKIDVEGNEFMVLKGMQEVLKNYSPVILCEIHTHLGDKGCEIYNLLRENHYSLVDIKGRPVGNGDTDSLNERHIIATK